MKPELMTVARPLAPEDIAAGMYVTVLHEHRSMIPFYFVSTLYEVENLKPFCWKTIPEKVRPLRVESVCVPFVLVESVDGKHKTIDVRTTSLAGLSDSFGKAAFKRLRPRKKKPRKAGKGDDPTQHRRSWRRLWRRRQD